ncbi:MAG: glycosyltransferase family 2 protein [Candidatus Hydrogenedens sp.]
MTHCDEIELSVVLPCLNEERTIGQCVQKTQKVFDKYHIKGEIIVADNNSTDSSSSIAEQAGAKVVKVITPGYGNTLRNGIKEAKGKYIIFFDSDLSYDPEDIPQILEKLREGYPIVLGSRKKGTIDRGSMPWLHRYIGTPIMTLLANIFFKAHITDINSGMRGMSRKVFDELDLHSEGMEFASEMIAKAHWTQTKIAEVPIHFHCDQRGRRPHLHSVRDGWRHLQLMFHYCSINWFLIPGFILLFFSYLVFFILPQYMDIYTSFFISLLTNIIATQILLIGVIAQGRVRGSKFRYIPSKYLLFLSRIIKVEKGMFLGLGICFLGMFLMLYTLRSGINMPDITIKIFFGGILCFVQGVQVLFSSILIGLFGIRVSEEEEFFRKS